MDKLNVFDNNKIRANLDNFLNDKFELKIYSSVDSTNSQAKEYIKKVENNILQNKKAVIFAADIQQKGRGRKGHNWLSNDPAGIAVSFVFKAKGELTKIPQITAAAGLAVNETFEKFKLQTKLKWPNDILVNDKKICGILSELVFDQNGEAFIVIGCGINLNNSNFNAEVQQIATSYYLEKNKKVDKNLFLSVLIKKMNYYIENYLNDQRKEIIDKWKKELDLIGKKIDLKHKNKDYTVLIKDILDSGELLVVFDSGKKRKLRSLNTSLDYNSLNSYNTID